MFIIYNIPGFLIGALGVFLGLVATVVLGVVGSPLWLSPGVLTIAVTWCAFGRSKAISQINEKWPTPALFYIPLFYWGLVVGVLSLLIGFVEVTGSRNFPNVRGPVRFDPRSQQFRQVEAGLNRNESDDEVFSALLMSMIAKVLPGESVNVAIKSSPSSVLVLMKLKDLKKIHDSNRKLLLESICELAETHRPGVLVFAGIKGRSLFGAVAIPGEPDEVGVSVDEKALYAFFDPPTKVADDSKPETSEPSTGAAKSQPESDSTREAHSDK